MLILKRWTEVMSRLTRGVRRAPQQTGVGSLMTIRILITVTMNLVVWPVILNLSRAHLKRILNLIVDPFLAYAILTLSVMMKSDIAYTMKVNEVALTAWTRGI